MLKVGTGKHSGCLPEALQTAISEMQLAATELVSNVILHGFPQESTATPEDSQPRKLHLCAFANPRGQLVVQVAHTGRSFNGNAAEVKAVTSPLEGQMGLFIISRCVDHVYYSAADHGQSYIWLIRNLTPAAVQHTQRPVTTDISDSLSVFHIPFPAIDASNATAFRDAIGAYLKAVRHLILDFSAVDFIDSAGLGSIVWAIRCMEGIKGEIRLCCPNKPVQALFDLVCMNRITSVFATQQQAVESFSWAILNGCHAESVPTTLQPSEAVADRLRAS